MRTNKTVEGWLDAIKWVSDEINKLHLFDKVTEDQIEKAIYAIYSDKLDCFWILDLVGHDFEYDELLDVILKNPWSFQYDSIKTSPSVLPENLILVTKALIKHNGEQWFVYRNDPDTFPSKPHLHCYKQNLKLDITNGYLYNIKRFVGSIKKKDLEFIRKELETMKYELPELALS